MKGCRPLSDHEVNGMLKAAHGYFGIRDRCLFAMGVNCGFRISELLSLKVSDVVSNRLIKSSVYVAAKNMKKSGSGAEGREIRMNRVVRQYVLMQVRALQHMGHWSRDTYLFRSREGGNMPISRTRAYQVITGMARHCGFDGRIGTHSMRKTFAGNMYNFMLSRVARGEAIDPLRETAKATGHRSVDSLENYLSFMVDNVNNALDSFCNRFEVVHG